LPTDTSDRGDGGKRKSLRASGPVGQSRRQIRVGVVWPSANRRV